VDYEDSASDSEVDSDTDLNLGPSVPQFSSAAHFLRVLQRGLQEAPSSSGSSEKKDFAPPNKS
jgi:hypothetical protein